MKKYTIDYLREHNLIVYEYKRGSHLYHLNVETSDEDYGGVFVCPIEDLIGLRSGYVEQVSDEKNDTVFYELGRWLELLLKANPTVLESLFAPEDCIIKSHPIIDEIRKISRSIATTLANQFTKITTNVRNLIIQISAKIRDRSI